MYLAILIFIGLVVAIGHVAYWAVLIFAGTQILDDLSGRGEKERNTTTEQPQPRLTPEQSRAKYDRLVARGKELGL